jgi:hypothetical protein
MQERENSTICDPAAHAPDDWIYVELKTDMVTTPLDMANLAGGAQATAYLCDASCNRLDGSLVTLFAPWGSGLRAFGADTIGNDAGGSPRRGAFGQARWNDRLAAYEVASLQRVALLLYGTVVADFTAADDSLVIENVTCSDW